MPLQKKMAEKAQASGWVLNALLGSLILSILWIGSTMNVQMERQTAQIENAREDLAKHTSGMYAYMEPMYKVASELAKTDPESMAGNMMLYRYLADYDALKKTLGRVETKVDGVDAKLDRLLEQKGRKP